MTEATSEIVAPPASMVYAHRPAQPLRGSALSFHGIQSSKTPFAPSRRSILPAVATQTPSESASIRYVPFIVLVTLPVPGSSRYVVA